MIVFGISSNGNAPPAVFIIVGCGALAYLVYSAGKIAQRSHNGWNQNDINGAWLALLLGVGLILFGVLKGFRG